MCDSLCVKQCGGVSACYHALVILNDVMFSYFFASFLLYSSTGSAAPLCPPPLTPRLCSGFCLLSPCIRVSLLSCWYRRRAAEHSGIPVDFFFFLLSFLCFDCFTVTVYVDSLFSLDSVFAGIQNWPTSLADTFFLADTESQGLPLSHSP